MINTAAIGRLLYPGLFSVFGAYDTYPAQWKEIFTTYQSGKAFEFDVEMKPLGFAAFKPEGQPMATDTMGQRIITTYIHKTVALSFNITKEAIEDDLYEREFSMGTKYLYTSLDMTKNVLGANILNNAFNPIYPVGDGQPLCSTAHPIDSGTFANRPAVAAAFSEASMEAAIIQIQAFPMQNGMLCQTLPEKVIISRANQFNACRLLQSTYRSNTASNDVNAFYHLDYIPQGYKVNQFIPSNTMFFIKTNAEDGLRHFQRTPLEPFQYADPETLNLKFAISERYSFGVSNVRSLWGSPGA